MVKVVANLGSVVADLGSAVAMADPRPDPRDVWQSVERVRFDFCWIRRRNRSHETVADTDTHTHTV